MRSRVWMGSVVAAVVAMVGCEWTGSDSETFSWNDNYDIVSFSATYRGANGDAVAAGTSVSDSTAGSTVNDAYQIGTGNDKYTYSGVLRKHPVVTGSLTITAGAFVLKDVNGDGTLYSATPGASGTVSYQGGGWSITLPDPLSSGVAIMGSYTAEATTDSSGGSTVVKTITVSQTGQYLTFNASNGMVFTGQINGMNAPETVTAESVIVAKFSVSSGSEKIVGTLTDSSTARYLDASWVRKGETLDVKGYASPATRRNLLSVTTEEVTDTTTTTN